MIPNKLSRYQSDWRMVHEQLLELQSEQYMVVGTKNIPNYLFDEVDWNLVDELMQKLLKIELHENH